MSDLFLEERLPSGVYPYSGRAQLTTSNNNGESIGVLFNYAFAQVLQVCFFCLNNKIQRTRAVPVFTALHGMQSRYSNGNSVCLSVCLSNACIVTKRKKTQSRFLYHAIDNLV